MADSLDCFSLCFCCFCFSICGQSETSSCRWLCPCCHSHRSKFDDDPAMNDPELDAIVERQLYEQRAAWDAANRQSKGQHHPYVPQVPAPAALPSAEKEIAREPRGTMQLPTSSHLSASQNASMAIPEPMHVQPGSGPTMSEKIHLDN
ncbi:hypothetical protein F5051DRAFT_433139 [Lentinula edodes]|nr:hypothetical protein F5051DRAFT_433139 [Lentinula edodes]